MTIGIIREGKSPADSRVAFSPNQCNWIQNKYPGLKIVVQRSPDRCFTNEEYEAAGIDLRDDLSDCDILFGIKEVPVKHLIPHKTYLFFSHTRKKQPYNRELFRTILDKDITLIDYECFQYENQQRILGFGYFAGIIGAHNGLMAYGKRTGEYNLGRAYEAGSFDNLLAMYEDIRLPDFKIVVTGSGRVASGVLELMKRLNIRKVEPGQFKSRGNFNEPVFTQLKGADLYKPNGGYAFERQDFFENASDYCCDFLPYASQSDILINGIYWDEKIPRLFECEDVQEKSFRIQTIADITDDMHGSVPCNQGDSTIDDPVYGVDRRTMRKTAPYLPNSIDIMAVGNLPNELPREASENFGSQLIKYVFDDLITGNSPVIERATMVRNGNITPRFEYLTDYAAGVPTS